MTHLADFTAGPAILPEKVEQELEQAQKDFLGSGKSIKHTSHRSTIVVKMVHDTLSRVRSVFGVSDDYAVALVPGGGTTQFKSWIYNVTAYPDAFKPRIAYIMSDVWAEAAVSKSGAADLAKAGICEFARIVPPSVHPVRPSVDPEWFRHVDNSFDMAYIVSNGTGGGTQYPSLDNIPAGFKPFVIADMSSDLGSRPFDITKYAYVFAGTQKCLGIQGITLVIARKDLLCENPLLSGTLSVLTQSSEKNAGGLFNTADVEAIYALNRMLAWIEGEGGLEWMARRSRRRAKALYNALDKSDLFEGLAVPESRSLMNATFRIKGGNARQYEMFQSFCMQRGIVGIGGQDAALKAYGPHFRASMYNGQTMENVNRLIEAIQEFD